MLRTAVDEPFGKITYTEAVKLLQESGQIFSMKVTWGADLAREHEKYA
jgi:asparaginyl-tRNA synthetase